MRPTFYAVGVGLPEAGRRARRADRNAVRALPEPRRPPPSSRATEVTGSIARPSSQAAPGATSAGNQAEFLSLSFNKPFESSKIIPVS